MGNAPQPQDAEFQGKSNLYATRDKPGAQDKSKIQDHGVPVDSARTGIEIVFLGKDYSLREDGEQRLLMKRCIVHIP